MEDSVSATLVVVTVLAFVVFLIGYIWNARSALGGQPGSGEARRWRSGRSVGLSWSDEISFGELKRGVLEGRVAGSPRLKQFLLMTVGGVCTVLGVVLLVGWALRPVGVVAALLIDLYVVVQLMRAFRRA